ncbi:MAG: diadenylate cyclase CdaA [Oscillospiraceae bacterium]|nr:diadenylate cyclase CdaA [Oscillospiraceae bacterium]
MENLTVIMQQIASIKLTDILDIVLVAFLIYMLTPLFRTTGTTRVAKVVVVVIVVSWLTDVFQLHTLNFILDQFLAIGLIALVVLFQPELRRMIDHLGSMKFKKIFGVAKPEQEMQPVIRNVINACEDMSRERVGALIVFERDNRLDEFFKTGTQIDAQVSTQLLRNIFFPKAALHDGAMIIRNGRVAAAACVLPLSESRRLSVDLGTRHRAGVGVSEATDAVVVIVSEETGAISVAVGGVLKRHLAPQTLERLLINELCPEDTNQEDGLVLKLRQKLSKRDKEDKHEK